MSRTRSAGSRITSSSAGSAGFGSARRWACVAIAGVALGAASCGDSKPATVTDAGTDAPAVTSQKLVILHTNDIHSHLMGFSPEADYTPATANDDATVGGMARLATAIGAAKADAATAGTPVLLLDGGDFMMGSLFELMATTAVPELVFMDKLGYDATTIGNHELDWTPTGLAGILAAAATNNVKVPILSSNMNFSATDPGDDQLKALVDGGALKPKLVKTVGTLKVGFFGLLGADAVTVTPQVAPLTFDPIKTAAMRMVTELRETDKVDLVIALSHSGIDHNGVGEDADLAAMVPGIDIIISGHTHDTLAQPKIVTTTTGKTVIVTAGSYTAYLGKLEVTVTPSATAGQSPTVVVDKYTLMPIDDTIPGDATTQAGVDTYITGLDAAKLTAEGLGYKKVVGKTGFDMLQPTYQETTVGDMITDAYRAVAGMLQPSAPPVLAVEGNGQIRSSILKGKTGMIWLEDLFRVLPIGIGPDQLPGYPLVTFYLNAKDIASGLELGGAPELVNDQYFLQISGIKVQYDMSKTPFGRVSALWLASPTPGGADTPLVLTDTTTCYKVVATNYVAGLLGVVKSFTGGALEVVAKDADCTTPIDPTTRFVDADPAMAGVQELKHWQALLGYVGGFPKDTDGVPAVPAALYGVVQGRITHK